MSTKLFIGNMTYSTTEDQLRELFEAIGQVDSVQIIFDKASNRPKGFGFVNMVNEEDAKRAIEELNGKELDGRELIVNEARPQQPRENRPFNGGNNFRNSNRY